uniref:Uncharacterized protein n=1 Tax=Manihot esculenta TaxID=3983 RepID=A0A2C9W6X1_MANES
MVNLSSVTTHFFGSCLEDIVGFLVFRCGRKLPLEFHQQACSAKSRRSRYE